MHGMVWILTGLCRLAGSAFVYQNSWVLCSRLCLTCDKSSRSFMGDAWAGLEEDGAYSTLLSWQLLAGDAADAGKMT